MHTRELSSNLINSVQVCYMYIDVTLSWKLKINPCHVVVYIHEATSWRQASILDISVICIMSQYIWGNILSLSESYISTSKTPK